MPETCGCGAGRGPPELHDHATVIGWRSRVAKRLSHDDTRQASDRYESNRAACGEHLAKTLLPLSPVLAAGPRSSSLGPAALQIPQRTVRSILAISGYPWPYCQ